MAGVEDRLTKSAKNSPAIPFWMWGAVALLLLFTLYIFWQTTRVRKAIEATNTQMETELAKRHELEKEFALEQRVATILTDPLSVKISMLPDRKDMPKLEAMWHAKVGLVVSGQNVPMPSGNHTFQLWLIPKTLGGKPIPSMTFHPDADGKFMLLAANPPEAIDATKALIITEEPPGGSSQPTSKPVWVGSIS